MSNFQDTLKKNMKLKQVSDHLSVFFSICVTEIFAKKSKSWSTVIMLKAISIKSFEN